MLYPIELRARNTLNGLFPGGLNKAILLEAVRNPNETPWGSYNKCERYRFCSGL